MIDREKCLHENWPFIVPCHICAQGGVDLRTPAHGFDFSVAPHSRSLLKIAARQLASVPGLHRHSQLTALLPSFPNLLGKRTLLYRELLARLLGRLRFLGGSLGTCINYLLAQQLQLLQLFTRIE